MHNPLAGQFNNTSVPNITGGMSFNLRPASQSPNQSTPTGGLVNPQATSQVPSVTPNNNTNDLIVNPQGNVPGSVPGNVNPGAPADNTSQGMQPNRDQNTAYLCKLGQEAVQEIVSRTQEIFKTLTMIQPPNGTIQVGNAANEKKAKIQEHIKTIKVYFKRLRIIYLRCNENSQLQGMEYTHIESLIPLKEEGDSKSEERKNSEAYRQASEECKELMHQVALKNIHLKEIIDHLRKIIWEINIMLAMRRS